MEIKCIYIYSFPPQTALRLGRSDSQNRDPGTTRNVKRSQSKPAGAAAEGHACELVATPPFDFAKVEWTWIRTRRHHGGSHWNQVAYEGHMTRPSKSVWIIPQLVELRLKLCDVISISTKFRYVHQQSKLVQETRVERPKLNKLHSYSVFQQSNMLVQLLRTRATLSSC